MVRYVGVALIFTVAACWQAATYRLSPIQISREKYTIFDLPEQQEMGQMLGRTLLPEERFWELGEENEIYFEAKRRLTSGLLYLEPIEFGSERDAYAQRLLADLERTKPDAVVIDQRWVKAIPSDSNIFRWLKAQYIPGDGRLNRYTYLVFFRKGSGLAYRMGAQ